MAQVVNDVCVSVLRKSGAIGLGRADVPGARILFRLFRFFRFIGAGEHQWGDPVEMRSEGTEETKELPQVMTFSAVANGRDYAST